MVVNRVTGTASGMDIDTMVSNLMKAAHVPYDQMNQKLQKITWQRDAYRDMNTALQDLRVTMFNSVSLQSNFSSKIITSSNTNVVTAASGGNLANATANITVSQLAQTAYGVSSTAISASNTSKLDATATLQSQAAKFQDSRAATLFSGSAFQLSLQTMKQDGTIGTPITVTIDPTKDSLNDAINKMNQSGAGLTAIYEAGTSGVNDAVSISMNYTGTVASGVVAQDTGTSNFLSILGFNPTNLANVTAGKNAQFTVNGLNFERTSNTNVIGGASYTLQGIGSATVSSATDVDKLVTNIETFVNKYNDTISKVYGKLSEEVNRDYPPLTDDQRKALTDTQIEQWETKAKSGLLRNDAILSDGMSYMRNVLTGKLSGITTSFATLSQIGITTSSNYLDNGKLVVDETKLRAAIQQDSTGVYQLFNGNSSTGAVGITKQLRDMINATIKSVSAKAGNTLLTNSSYELGKEMNDLTTRMKDETTRLSNLETRYYKQFNNMDSAIAKFNKQAAYIQSKFGG